MMERLDKLSIKIYNWLIITLISVAVYIFLAVIASFDPTSNSEKFTYKQIHDAFEDWLGVKKHD